MRLGREPDLFEVVEQSVRYGIVRAVSEELECFVFVFECVCVRSSEGGFPSEDWKGLLVVERNGREHPEAKRADTGNRSVDFLSGAEN